MQQNDIGYVLNASHTCPKPDFIPESHFLRVPVNDSFCEKILPWLDRSLEFIGQPLPPRPAPAAPMTSPGCLCFRDGQSVQRTRPRPLPGRDLPLGHHRHRVHHGEDGAVPGRGLQVRSWFQRWVLVLDQVLG